MPFKSGKEHPLYKTGKCRQQGLYQKKAHDFYGIKCMKCGSEKSISVHHIDKNYFNNDISNLRVLCNSCHSKIHGRENRLKYKSKKERKEAEKRWKIKSYIKKATLSIYNIPEGYYTTRDIMKMFSISRQRVHQMINGKKIMYEYIKKETSKHKRYIFHKDQFSKNQLAKISGM
jgi:hypothetical protein